MFSKKQPCPKCKSKIKQDFSFCPHCGCDIRNPEKDLRDFGLLGKNDVMGAPLAGAAGGMGFTDKLVNSLFQSIMKAMENQMRNQNDARAEAQSLPNGIQISFGVPQQRKQPKTKQRTISQEQVKRMTGLPRVEAKTDIRRLSDKVLYELKAPGIGSADDVFVSKVESGYEIKAIGGNKVYFNTLTVDLPLKAYTVHEKGLTVEFGLQ